jgi:hypothetical protein
MRQATQETDSSAIKYIATKISFRLAGRVGNRGALNAFSGGQGLAVAAAIFGVAREIVDGVGLRDARAL